MKLGRKCLEKPWGRCGLPRAFGEDDDKRIGEIWYKGAPNGFPLLAKYLFTSERLSIQVHPDDDAARERGHGSGKEECWYIVEAEADACVGLGLKEELTRDDLRRAALCGAIEDQIDWRPVAAGDFVYVPAGTVHAIGPGVVLAEIQQSADITYRLYDYGRPRELHLDDAVAVATLQPFRADQLRHVAALDHAILHEGPPFSIALCDQSLAGVPDDRALLVVPLKGEIIAGKSTGAFGDCLYASAKNTLNPSPDARMLIAWGDQH